ncbi:MAG TPA: hypothetical protein PLN64_01550 [Candidatus Bipolaricaulis anaerobius]|nr:hypothetical protein [Candidatus Bipolaricaulis anaerobius]
MAWGDKTTIIDAASVTTETFSTAFTLNPGETAHVQVDANFPSTPTDSLVVNVYSTLDASSENWDDSPVYQFMLSKAIDPHSLSFLVFGLYKVRLGVFRDGTTDTITVSAWYRVDGVSL